MDLVMGKSATFTIGPYACYGELLGRGSFASVYKGYHKDTKQLVAIKVIDVERLTHSNNPKIQQNIEREIEVMKEMKHENIVELYEIYKSLKGDLLYMIMECCARGDLSKFLAKQPEKRLNEEETRYFMRQLASGLRFLRSKQVIHRDLKPQNLLLTTSGSSTRLTLKIADFGFAKFMENQSLAETLCGSPLYMAPELLKFQKYNVKADLWSVGAIMFEMLTGGVPFKCKNQMELMRMMENAPVVFPEQFKKLYSPACLDLVMSLLRKDYNQRISWEEFFLHPWLGLETHQPMTSQPSQAIAIPSSTSSHILSMPPHIGSELPSRRRSQSLNVFRNSPYKAMSPPSNEIKFSSVMEEARSANLLLPDPIAEENTDSFEKDCVIIKSDDEPKSPPQASKPQPQGAQQPLSAPGNDKRMLEELDALVARAFILSEVAEVKAPVENPAAFVIYIKTLTLLRQAHLLANTVNLHLFDNMDQVEIIDGKVQHKFGECLERAERLKPKLYGLDVIPSAEKVLYEYALQIGKRAAIDEEMFDNFTKSEVMYRTAITIFEQIHADCTEESDKEAIRTHIQVFLKKLEDVRKKLLQT